MSGLDKIISRLESDCEAECEAILNQAETQADSIIECALSDARKNTEKQLENARKEALQIAEKTKSAAALENRQLLLQAKVELVDKCVNKALLMLRQKSAEEYFSLLALLIKKNALEESGEILFSEKDKARLPESFIASLPEKLTVSKKTVDIADGFILKYGNIEINCSFDALFSASKDELKAVAVEQLFN